MNEYISVEVLMAWAKKRKSLSSMIPYEDLKTFVESQALLRVPDEEVDNMFIHKEDSNEV